MIQNNPGIKFREVMRETKMSNGIVSHHIKKLEKNGLISIERISGSTRFYPAGLQKEEIVLIRYLRQKMSCKIVLVLIHDSELSFKNMADLTQISSSSLSKYLFKLVRDDIVHKKFENRKKLYHLKKINSVIKVIDRYFHNLSLDSSIHKENLASFFFLFVNLTLGLFSNQLFDSTLFSHIV